MEVKRDHHKKPAEESSPAISKFRFGIQGKPQGVWSPAKQAKSSHMHRWELWFAVPQGVPILYQCVDCHAIEGADDYRR